MVEALKNRFSRFLGTPWFPVILSALVAPGIGQFYNRCFIRGLFLLSSSLLSFMWFSNLLVSQVRQYLSISPENWKDNPEALQQALILVFMDHPGTILTFYLLFFVIWIYGVIDAYLSSKDRVKTKNETINII